MAKLAICPARDAEQLLVTVGITGKKHAMKLHIGPGDTASPVLTLMLPIRNELNHLGARAHDLPA